MLTRRIILIILILAILGGLGFLFWKYYRSTENLDPESVAEGTMALPQDDAFYDENTTDPDEDAGSIVIPNEKETSGKAKADVSLDADTSEQPGIVPLTQHEVLTEAEKTSTTPLWLQLLAMDAPLKTAVQLIDAIANGERPVGILPFLIPQTPFTASQDSDGRLVIDNRAISRFQPVIALLEEADAAKLADLYRKAEPLLQKECQELGYQDTNIRTLLTQACDTILTIPDFNFEPTLQRRAEGLYVYEDENFEELNDVQKLFVRLGYAHCMRLKKLCSDFADALELYQRQ